MGAVECGQDDQVAADGEEQTIGQRRQRIRLEITPASGEPGKGAIGADAAGQTFNINADTAAAAVAAQLQADVFLLLTDVEGVFRDYHDKSSLITELSFAEATAMIQAGVVDGGMIPKVQACMGALEKGARLARVVDGRRPHCIVESLQPGNVAGTAVVKHKG